MTIARLSRERGVCSSGGGRPMVARLAGVAAVVLLLAVPTAQAATADTATAEASPGPYLVNTPITLTSTTPCTIRCRLIWTELTGTRLGDKIGEGETVQASFSTVGWHTVKLDLSEFCNPTAPASPVCRSSAYVQMFVEAAAAPGTPPSMTATGLDAEATGMLTPVQYAVTATEANGTTEPTTCSPAAGNMFPVGSTQIDCAATAADGKVTQASFDVAVTDTTPPALSVPAALSVAATSPAGAAVSFAASATDLVDGAVAPVCSMPSGMTFPVGSTLVACTATDNHQNTATA